MPLFGVFWLLSGLSSLGVAQPLLDLLGRNSQFLVVHNLERWDIVFLALVLCFGPAALFWALIWLAGRINEGLAKVVFAGTAVFLLTVILVPFFDSLILVD